MATEAVLDMDGLQSWLNTPDDAGGTRQASASVLGERVGLDPECALAVTSAVEMAYCPDATRALVDGPPTGRWSRAREPPPRQNIWANPLTG